MSFESLNEKIYSKFSGTENYKEYLSKLIPDWEKTESILNKNNLQYLSNNVLKFSIRLDLSSGKKKHIDFYEPTVKRPYKRAYLDSNNQVTKIRYYELGTREKNYDVIVDENFFPVYTVEYYNETKRYIDWVVQPGKLYYDKQNFLKSVMKASLGSTWSSIYNRLKL